MKASSDDQPLFSVIVPTRHRNELLARCLECLAPGIQTLDRLHYEVIVSDAGQASTAEALVRQRFPWARWAPAPGAWPSANRNRGAAAARGAWVVFLDDDIYLGPGYLAAVAAAVEPGDVDVVEGRIECPDPLEYSFDLSPVNLHGGVYWSANLAVRRRSFLALGGFDEDFERGEDLEFAHRFLRAGLRARFAPAAVVFHPRRRLSLRGYWRHTLNDRWRLMVRMKTGSAASPGTPILPSVLAVLRVEGVNHLRTSYHFLRRFRRAHWRAQVLGEFWKWGTFPFMLPYLVYWEVRFRRELAAKTNVPSRQIQPT